MGKFIYAPDENARDVLLAHGYTLLQESAGQFVFVNQDDKNIDFALGGGNLAFSNSLTL